MNTWLALFLSFVFLNAASSEAKTVVLFLGDSITAGYGVKAEENYPSLLQQAWSREGKNVQVINGAESGSLSSSVLSRIDFYLKRATPKLIIISIGGNDARQLTPVAQIKKQIVAAVEKAKASGAKVALAEMRIFPNLGKQYAQSFQKMYSEVAAEQQVTLLPFILEKVAGRREYNISDGFHPNAQGHQLIFEKVKPLLERLL